jgi:predicted chitinase
MYVAKKNECSLLKFKKQHILLILFTISITLKSTAQQVFPVLANLQVSPPYSPYLSDYSAAGSTKLQLNLFLKDLTRTGYQCRLRLRIEGLGITIQSRNDFSVVPSTLNGGEMSTLSGSELAAYLNPQNLVFQGIDEAELRRSGGKLPEGLYRLTIEVLDYYRRSVVSNAAMAVLPIFLAYPPIVNLPLDGGTVEAAEPQNLVFQWTPRNTGSANSGYGTAYEVKLVEIVPQDRDANDAMRSSRPVFQTLTDRTMLVYGPSEPALVPGASYALQVRAIDAEGRDLFVNNGYSEVVRFTYGQRCPAPPNLMLELAGTSAIRASWNILPHQQAFTLRYRQAGSPSAQWFEREVFSNSEVVGGLRPATAYEFQVGARCAYGYGDYSGVQTFNVPNGDFSQGDFVCGNADNLPEVAQGTPLPALVPPMVFLAGRFPVQVVRATGSDGTFSGTGTVGVPFLRALSFQVSFQNVSINTDMKLTGGRVVFVRRQLEQGIQQGIAAITVRPDADGNVAAISSNGLPTIVDAAISPWPGPLPTYDPVARTVRFTASVDGGEPMQINLKLVEGQPPLTFQDKNQETFGVDEKGSVAYRGKVPPSGFFAGGGSGGTFAVDNGRGRVEFLPHPQQRYGLDIHDGGLAAKSRAYADAYRPLSDGNAAHRANWKSLASGQADRVLARLTITDPKLDPKKLFFTTGKGDTLSATAMGGNDYAIDLAGALPDNSGEVYAAYPDEKGGTKGGGNTYLGRLDLYSFAPIGKKLVVVPVNGAGAGLSAAVLQNGLNAIYAPAVVSWTVELAPNFATDARFDDLESGNSGAMAAYTDAQKQLVKAYRDAGNKLEDGSCYIFVVRSLSNGDAGYMVRGGQTGFVSSTDVRTFAHELGHGAFRLPHTWDAYGLPKGSTDNLMDYGSGTGLWYAQWRYMRNPDVIFRPLQADEKGAAQASNKDLLIRILKSIKGANSDGSFVFDDFVSAMNLNKEGFVDVIDLDGNKLELGFVGRRSLNAFNVINLNKIGSMYSAKKQKDNLTFYEFSLVENLGTLDGSYKKIESVFELYVLTKDTAFFEGYLAFDKSKLILKKDEEIVKPKGYELKAEDLSKIFPYIKSEKAKEIANVINKYSDRFEINTPLRMAHFLGQIGAETGLTDLLENSYAKQEILTSKKTRTLRPKNGEYVIKYCDLFDGYNKVSDECPFPYCDDVIIVPDKERFKEGKTWYAKTTFMKDDNTLKPKSKYYINSPNNLDFFNYVYACQLDNGSVSSKDGSRFRGRGFIQLTGLVNYKEFQRKWNSTYAKDNPKNFICRSNECDKNLELLNSDVEIAMLAAMAYWNDADANLKSTGVNKQIIKQISKIVNGGLHGFKQRVSYTTTAYKILSNEN